MRAAVSRANTFVLCSGLGGFSNLIAVWLPRMTQQEQQQTLPFDSIERRSQPRINQPHSAEVLIEQPRGNIAFPAVLVDTSQSGMCIRHWHKDLTVGQVTRISSPAFSEAAARVVWNWAVGPVVISGLQKIDGPSGMTPPLSTSSIEVGNTKKGNSTVTRGTRVWPCALGTAVGIVVLAGWHFRAALLHLWSLS